ncbi:MAG: hypothetical protein K2H14_09570 [Muribaculaceae bacterium]|nr:hypothetical protein [Muribaculaceae bacterium]
MSEEKGNGKIGTGTGKSRVWRLLRPILKIVGIAALTVFALFIAVCSVAVWILTPQRLTPLVEKQASAMLLADVKASRVELTFWHTFPELTVEVDSLQVVSRSLSAADDSLRRSFPADADSLLSIGAFRGGMNLLPLLAGRIALYDVVFYRPSVNLFQVSDSVANYLIALPGEEKEAEDNSPLVIPSVSINRFAVIDAGPLRFRSLVDSTDVSVSLSAIELKGKNAPLYSLAVDGHLDMPLIRDFNFDRLVFGADGEIEWDMNAPESLRLKGFKLGVHDYEVTVDADTDFSRGLTVRSLDLKTGDLPVAEILTHLPEGVRDMAAPLKSDMKLRGEVSLTAPWNAADTLMPSFRARIEVPSCEVLYENLHFNDFAAEASVDFHGDDLDSSVIRLERLHIDGDVIDVDLSATLTDPASDAQAEGEFVCAFDFSRLPAKARRIIPGNVEGKLSGRSEFKFRAGDFTGNRFHRIKLKGEVALTDFVADIDSIGHIYTDRTVLKFGSSNSFVSDNERADSLLTLSLKADTLAASVSGMDLRLRNLRAGAGVSNRSGSTDTTAINPFGFKIEFDRLAFDSPADTLRLRLRQASAGGALKRYEGEAKVPRVDLSFSAGGIQFGQSLTKVALRKADVDLTVNMRKRRQRMPADSVPGVVRMPRRDTTQVVDKEELRLGQDERKLLRRWDFSGRIQAESGRMVTPAFPIRNRMEHIDFKFNQDSLRLNNLRYKVGESDFLINGSVSNLRRALTSRRDNTLGVRLMVMSDTINVNQIVNALFAGGQVSEQADSAMVWSDNDSDDAMIAAADTVSAGPVLLPRNIDALFVMRARNVLYSDLELHSFRGDVLVSDGVLTLRNLSASADVGSLRVDGLYSAVSADSLRFGMGMKVSDFRLDRLGAVIPAIDSILPVMKGLEGIVNADVAVTTDITPAMDIDFQSLHAAINIEGDSLVLLDADTFKTLSKWLMFRNRHRNIIDHMAVELQVENSTIEVFPFMFDIDRYQLGVMGHNDMDMNMDYHVSVLKSPMPFKFGINIKGNPDNFKIRLGGAKVGKEMVGERQAIAAGTRVNLVEQINGMLRRGLTKARNGSQAFSPRAKVSLGGAASALIPEATVADTLRMIREGLMENPDPGRFPIKDSAAGGVLKKNS